MRDKLKDLMGHQGLAGTLQRESGMTRSEATEALKQAEAYGIDPQEYVEAKLYELPEDELKSIGAEADQNVRIAARNAKTSYALEAAKMYRIKQEYGITYTEYCQHAFWKYSGDELTTRIRERLQAEAKSVRRVAKHTGWTEAKAEEKMRAAKKRWPAVTYRKYSSFEFYKLSDAEINARVKEWGATASRNRAIVMRATRWSSKQVRDHMTRFQYQYDIDPKYYVLYRGWELTDEQAASYATQRLSNQLSDKYNRPKEARLLGNKELFVQEYDRFLGRKHWVNTDGATLESFLDFADGIDEAFCKPFQSGGGIGTYKLDLTQGEDALKDLYEDLMTKPNTLVEESVKQHEALSRIYPDAVNTIRLMTISTKTSTDVVAAAARFGVGGITDNFSADGVVCDVDVETGKIVTNAINKKGKIFETHPVTGEKFIGFQIPHWQKAVQLCKDAMQVQAGVNYVGWDCAITPDGAGIIEGNYSPGLNLMQAPYADQKLGRRYLFEPYLDGEKK